MAKIGTLGGAGAAGDLERVDAALGVLAVGEQHEHGGQAPRAGARRVGHGRARRLEAALEAEAHRGAADGGQPVQRAVDARTVGRGRGALLGEVGERDQPEPERLRQLLAEPLGRADRRREAVRLDVGGVHGARDVGDHHHRGRALAGGDRALRPGQRDDQRGEREQDQQRRQVAAEAGPRGDEVGHQRRVAERGRLAPLAAAASPRRRAPPAGRAPARRGGSGSPKLMRPAPGPPPGGHARRDGGAVRRARAHGGLAAPEVVGELAQPVALAWRARRGRRPRGAAPRPPPRARPPPPRRTGGAPCLRDVLTATWRPVSGSMTHTSPIGVSSISRGSRTSTASTPWRPRSERSGPSQSIGPRKSDTTTTSPRARASAATRAAASPIEVLPAPSPPGSRRSSPSSPSRPSRPWRGLSTRGSVVAEREHAEPVAAPRGDVADGQRHALGDVGLAAVGGAERHRGRHVEHAATRSARARRRARARAARVMRAVTFQSMWRTSSPGR